MLQLAQVGWSIGPFLELDDAAQAAAGGAFGKQQLEPGVGAQLHRQAAVDLGVGGEQGRAGAGLAQQAPRAGRIVGVREQFQPAAVQAHVHAAHAGVGQQEAGQQVFVHSSPRSVSAP